MDNQRRTSFRVLQQNKQTYSIELNDDSMLLEIQMMNRAVKIHCQIDDFIVLLMESDIFIDKSIFIAELMIRHQCFLLTRPRKWGKSLILSMLVTFFQMKVNTSTGNIEQSQNRVFFSGGQKNGKTLLPLKIFLYKRDLVDKYQGQHPVIHMTWKDFNGITAQQFFDFYKRKISQQYKKFQYLMTTEKGKKMFNSTEQQDYFLVVQKKALKQTTLSSLQQLVKYLYKFHSKKVVVLIDEYDHPFNHMLFHYHQKTELQRKSLNSMIQSIIGPVFKGNSQQVFKAILFGVYNVLANEFNSGLNNIINYPLLDKAFWRFFGFSENEVKMLIKQTLQKKQNAKVSENQLHDIIKYWYNGYYVSFEDPNNKNQIITKSLYNPYDVTMYLYFFSLEGKLQQLSYWFETGSIFFFQILFSTFRRLGKISDLIKISSEGWNKDVAIQLSYQRKPYFEQVEANEFTQDQMSYIMVNSGYYTGILIQKNTIRLNIPNNQIFQQLSKHLKMQIKSKLAITNEKNDLNNPKEIQQMLIESLKSLNNSFGEVNQKTFDGIFFYLFLINCPDYTPSSDSFTYNRNKLDHIFYPVPTQSQLDKNGVVFIHEYKYDKKGDRGEKLSQQGLFQIYEKNYIDHPLSRWDETSIWNKITMRGICISKNSAQKKMALYFTEDVTYTIEESITIRNFFDSAKQNVIQEMKNRFIPKDKSNSFNPNILHLIKELQQEKQKRSNQVRQEQRGNFEEQDEFFKIIQPSKNIEQGIHEDFIFLPAAEKSLKKFEMKEDLQHIISSSQEEIQLLEWQKQIEEINKNYVENTSKKRTIKEFDISQLIMKRKLVESTEEEIQNILDISSSEAKKIFNIAQKMKRKYQKN